MRACVAILLGLALAGPVAAQNAASASGGEIRVLDKLNGVTTDVSLQNGVPQQVGLLLIRMNDCRYPARNPSGDAYAALTVTYRNETTPAFDGWMIASSPALNAMDHPRYDVWVLRCST
ncbi:DUF2155 domain-containing protein [Yoonia sp. R2331]|uniref:DUF2155 domain-containing protein n=1 Tax=Yoonia sp. R2331 TaxID=3237238 RepID=UPI0034E52859